MTSGAKRAYLNTQGHTVEVRRTAHGFAPRILLNEAPLWGCWKSATRQEAQRKLDDYAAEHGWTEHAQDDADGAIHNVEVLKTALQLACGELSGCPGHSDRHPEETLQDIMREAEEMAMMEAANR